MRESDIRTWFFPLVELHLGQYTEWIRINYKSLLPDPFQRNDGGAIRFSFHIDRWLLLNQTRRKEVEFSNDPAYHLEKICWKVFNKHVDCRNLVFKKEEYLDLIMRFEMMLKQNRHCEEKIYIGQDRARQGVYSYKELYSFLDPDNQSCKQGQDDTRDVREISRFGPFCKIAQ